MAGKYGFSGRLDTSGQLKETEKQTIREAKEAQALERVRRGRTIVGGRAVDPSIINTLDAPVRANMEQALKSGDYDPIQRRVVEDAEKNIVYAPLDRTGQAASIAFAATQASKAMMAQTGVIPPNVSMIKDPLVRKALTGTGFDPNMNFQANEFALADKYGPDPGPILEASKGTWMDEAQRRDEVNRLVESGIIPIGEEGGTTTGVHKKITKDQFWRGFRQRRGSWEPAVREDIDSIMEKIWGDTRILQTILMEGMKAEPMLLEAFAKFAGSPEGLQNESLYFALMLAYWRTLEEARFADHSKEEKAIHYQYGQERGKMVDGIMTYPVDPEIYSSDRDEGRHPRTPRKRVLEEKIGDYIERVTRTKIENTTDKQIIGHAILDFIERTPAIKGHGKAITAVDPEASWRTYREEDVDPSKINQDFELVHEKGIWKLIEDVSIDENLNEFLALSKGVRDLLQPNFRRHVRVVKLADEDKKNIWGNLTGQRSSGVSPIRINYENIQSSFPNMLDELGMNMAKSLYTRADESGDWFQYLVDELKLKPEQYQLILQEAEWITQNSPDGKTFYLDVHRRSSGRTGHTTLLMADMKPMRALTIPRDASYTFKVDRKGVSNDEKVFLYSVLGMLGMADAVPEALDNKINEILNDGDHLWRRIGSALNLAAVNGVLPTKPGVQGITDNQGNPIDNPAFITVKDLRDSGAIKEGLHSLQAFRALDNYLKAKGNPNVREFSSKFISELDAAQSGPTIQAAQIGNWHGLYAGGMPMSDVWWDARKNRKGGLDSRFALPKLYASTAQIAQDKIEGMIKDGHDTDFIQFINHLFKDPNTGTLDRLWENAIGFAKTGLVGASYGQGEAGSIISISEEIKKYFEETLSPDETNDMIAKLNANKRFGNEAYIDRNSYRLNFSNNAYMQLNKLAEIYTRSMWESDNRIYEYSKNMRRAFRTYVRFADFAQKDKVLAIQEGRAPYIPDFKAPEMVYKEPTNLDNVYTEPWADGMVLSMLDNHINDKWKKLNILDSDIFYQTGAVEPNLAREVIALDFDNEQGIRSKAISRMPVISIHGLDDLIQAITVNELYRKYGPDGTVDPGSFNFFVSVWDAGLIQPHMRARYMEEYNKAFREVMKWNKFFSQLTRGWEDATAHINPNDIIDGQHKSDFAELRKAIRKMRALTDEMHRGTEGSEVLVPEEKRAGIRSADKAMQERGIHQIYAGEAFPVIEQGRAAASTPKTSIFGDSVVPVDSRDSFKDFLKDNLYS